MAQAKYRVVTLSIAGKGRNIYNLGDTITQSNVSASIDELLQAGAIVTEDDWVSRETRIQEEEKKRLAQPVAFVQGWGNNQSILPPTVHSDAKAPGQTVETPTADTLGIKETKPADNKVGGDASLNKGGDSSEGGEWPQEVKEKTITDYTKNEIIAELKEIGVDFDPQDNKETLYKLLVKAKATNA